MKKSLLFLTGIALLFALTACGNSGAENSGMESDPANSGALNHDNPRVDYTSEEIAAIIDKMPNLKISDELFFADVPKEIDHVSTFYCGTTAQLTPEESLDEFIEVFEYLFPNHEMDKDCLYYYGIFDDHSDDRLHLLYENNNYELYMKGILENYYFYYSEEGKESESSVQASIRSPFGSDICMFNKGVCNKIAANQNGRAEYYAYEHFLPAEYFEYVGDFCPDSGKTFPLIGGEISIKDAVDFFEEYIGDLPCRIDPYYSIHVNSVQVYKVREDLYCYYFVTSKSYDGIAFDSVDSGNRGGRNNRDLGFGVVVKTDDVDHIYASFKTATVMEEEQFTDIIPFENAVKTVSEKMTDYTDFVVEFAKLVYCTGDNISGSWQLGETKQPVFPAWKFLLFNPNDNVYYTCYVNALDGSFEYYK